MSTPPKWAFAPENLEQAINPWSWWFGASANENQTGFINVNVGKSRNPGLERSIVHDVAGYGMQLGVIEETIEMMIGFLPKSQLNAEQKAVIQRFQDMAARIKVHKEKAAMAQLGSGGVEAVISGLETLKKSDPKAYAAVSKRLKEAL